MVLHKLHKLATSTLPRAELPRTPREAAYGLDSTVIYVYANDSGELEEEPRENSHRRPVFREIYQYGAMEMKSVVNCPSTDTGRLFVSVDHQLFYRIATLKLEKHSTKNPLQKLSQWYFALAQPLKPAN